MKDDKLPNHRFVMSKSTYEFYNGNYYLKVSELRKGSAFGELALLTSESTRYASVVCESDVNFATLDRKNFQLYLKKIESGHVLKLLNFF